MGWQADVAAQARARAEEDAAVERWVVHLTDPVPVSRVWAQRYTKELHDAGARVAEDLSLMATCYERHVVASFQTCEDGIHVLCEFDPPIEALAVRAECMSGVVGALRRSGCHARCTGPDGKHYEF